MASPNPYTKRRSPPTSLAPPSVSTKSNPGGSGFFSKSVIFAILFLALPLFPSQAPDFVGETVLLTKFWELIHLLFVGIAVAYGLFSRRNLEPSSSVDSRTSRVDESSLSYVSRIFQVSSVFDEDFDDFVDVRSEVCSSNVIARASMVVKESRSESFGVETESDESFEHGKTSQVQAWNSQYFQGRSKVVVARPAYGVDGHIVHQPLGLPVRSLRSALRDNAAAVDTSFSYGAVNGMADESFEEVMAAPSSPVQWHAIPEMMGMGDNYPQALPVDETEFATFKSRSSRSTVSSSSSSSSRASSASHTQSRFSPSRSVSEESLNSHVEESDKDKSLEGSSRATSPSLPQSPSLTPPPPLPQSPALSPPPPPLPKLVNDDDDDGHKRASHSRHYSDGSLLEEDVRKGFEYESEESKASGRRTESFTKNGSKSLKLPGESSRRGNKPRRSYPPDSIPSPVGDADDSTPRRRNLQQKNDCYMSKDITGKGFEAEHNHPRVRKKWIRDSLDLELPTEDSLIEEKDVTRKSRGSRDALPEKDITRNPEDDVSVDFDKPRHKDLPGNNKELKSNSPRFEPQSRRASSNISLRGKSVRTIRSDRNVKDRKPKGDSSDERVGKIKSRRQRQEELSLVPYQEKVLETRTEPEPPEEEVIEDTEAEQPRVTLEEEQEEAAWESQSNASHDHNEVDRKAGEFIAKFREQIRLQKLTSGEQPRGSGGGGGGGRGGTGIIRNSHFR